ncbi:hypothetical protein J5J86_13895 [Aquabacter sp. L1I39]|uniref:hypothetical protein n=1 Tax=Aquabacter sp. L1I39 TaxID=2820278 RepID=UPI001ADAF068|nr:hypothetical protein [Aquabacter sp. L1I39]QTL01898.1 hypothetical protein J5J86_13895 [Aquabacter sp. L1I39]
MTDCIILTPAQAAAVDGETSPGCFLRPRALADGHFALSALVLADAAHETAWPLLIGLPHRIIAAEEWAPSSFDD